MDVLYSVLAWLRLDSKSCQSTSWATSIVHIVELDLRKTTSWDFLRFLTKSRRPFHFHAAPPCGTASRARDRPLATGFHGPPPVRSEQYPLGFPWLKGLLKEKVTSANRIYIELAAFIFEINLLNIGWSVENPASSYLWSIAEYALLKEKHFFVIFHSCIHGGQRKKLTGWLTNISEMKTLGGLCQGDHTHLPWGYTEVDGKLEFDTSKEAAYPKLLCERVATILATKAGALGMALNPEVDPQRALVAARVATNKQPRGRKLAPILSEFERTMTVRVKINDVPCVDSKNLLETPYRSVPSGSKLLRMAKGKRGVDDGDFGSDECIRVFGIYRDMAVFYTAAITIKHPFDTFRAIPDDRLRVICNTMQHEPLNTMRHRLELLTKWRNKAEELQEVNSAIFSNMDPGCATVLKGKHLALLETLANDCQWPDRTLHDQLRQGFRLVGMQEPTGVFAQDIKPRSLSEEELVKQAKFIKPALWGKIKAQTPTENDRELWDTTMAEVRDKKWLQGPYSFEELEVMFNGQWLPVRRFPVIQRSKLRPIDDFSEPGTNSSFSYLEKVDLKALDESVWIPCAFVRLCL